MAEDPRFLTLADVAEVLNTSGAQVYALVRRGELPAIKIGGRGQWRVERVQLEEFIQRMYAQTRTFVDEHPFVEAEAASTEVDGERVSDGIALIVAIRAHQPGETVEFTIERNGEQQKVSLTLGAEVG